MDITDLLDTIGFSPTATAQLIGSHDADYLHRHALQTLWLMSQGRTKNPTGWMIASLRGDFKAPFDMPVDLQSSKVIYQLDEQTFAEVTKGQVAPRLSQFRKLLLQKAKRV